MIRETFLWLIAGSMPLQTSARFDLACVAHPPGVEQPVSRTVYHVDLNRQVWCSDACKAWAKLSATAGKIMFVNRKERHADGSSAREELSVDRYTGALYWLDAVQNEDGMGHATEYEGDCKRAPYSITMQRKF